MRYGLLIYSCLVALAAQAGTEVSVWHSYTPPSGETHCAFILTHYKRGLFFGSCGPSTRSLQWSYSFDLKGAGPTFTRDQIEMKDEALLSGAAFHPAAGEIALDPKRQRVRIDLTVSTNGVPARFIGNGEYKFRASQR